MKPTCQRVLKLLQTGPRLTHELCQPDVGGVNFKQRIYELRHDYGYTITEQRVRQGSHRFTLITNATGPATQPALASARLTVAAEPPEPTHPRTLAKSVWGEHKVCSRCAFQWHATGMAHHCPNCKAGTHWTEDHWTHTDAARRAKQIDPAAIRRELTALEAARHSRPSPFPPEPPALAA